MSLLGDFFSDWSFRTSKPVLQIDQEYTATITGYDQNRNRPIIRIGDTILTMEKQDLGNQLVDKDVRFEVTDFNSEQFEGEGRIIEVLGEGSF